MTLDRAACPLLLPGLQSGLWLTLKHVFWPKATINSPSGSNSMRPTVSAGVTP